MLIVILCNIMSRVATANNNGLFPLGVSLGFGEFARVNYAFALEIIDALYIRGKVCFTRVTGGLDYMPWVKSA